MHSSSGSDAFSRDVLQAAVAGNRMLAERVANAFLTIKPELQSRLWQALSARDLRTAAHAAHELKGMAGVMGARQLARVAAAIEAGAADAAPEQLAELQASLAVEWEAVVAALGSPLPGGP